MGTSVLRDAKIWLTNFCSLPDDIREKIERKLGNAPHETKIHWNKRSSSDIDLEDPAIQRREEDLENPKSDVKKLHALQDKILVVLKSVKAFPGEVKEKFETRFLSKVDEREDLEFSNSSDAEDYEQGYDIVEVHNFIFVIGGSDEGNGDPLATVEAYDCFEKKWLKIAPLPVQTTACSAATLTGIPAILVVGGYGGWKALNTVQIYDFVTKKWDVIQHMRKRRWGSLVLGTDHGVFVAGGCDQGSVLRSTELFSIKRREWYRLSSMLTPRCNFAGAVLGRKVIVAGGGSGFYFNSAMNSVEMFDGDEGKWSKLPPMRHKRYGCSAVKKDGLFIVVGGCNEIGEDVQEVEVFDEKTRQWSKMAPLPKSSSLCRSLIIDTKLVVFGADGLNETGYEYDFEEERWQPFTALPRGRNAFAVVNVGI